MFRHLKDCNMSYWEHFARALCIALALVGLAMMLVAHAVYPDILRDYTSRKIKELANWI